MKKRNAIPFDFVLEKLDALHPVIKPMFGCHAIYIEEKIMLILRKKDDKDPDNGVWIVSDKNQREELKKTLPSLEPISIFGKSQSDWQMISEKDDYFEQQAMTACDLILKGDLRIGKIPASKKKKISSSR